MTDPAVIYQQLGFALVANLDRQMEMLRRDIYQPSADGSTSS